jgi:hypothetical protein
MRVPRTTDDGETNRERGQAIVRPSENARGERPPRGDAAQEDPRFSADYGAGTMVLSPYKRSPTLRCPEIPGIDEVALHLDVQRLVVHAKEPGGLALVAAGGVKCQAYRLSLRLGGNALGELFQ